MSADRDRPTFLQRRALRELARTARRQAGAALGPDGRAAYRKFGTRPRNRAIRRFLRALPSSPRCGHCGAPFEGPARIVGPPGHRPSRRNPNRLRGAGAVAVGADGPRGDRRAAAAPVLGVDTAARPQAHALGGEALVCARAGRHLEPAGVHRVRWWGASA